MTQSGNDRLHIEEFERRLAAVLRRILQEEKDRQIKKGDNDAQH